MKILFSILTLILITRDCNNTSKSSKTQENGLTITYEASSRGSFEEISVSKDSFSISHDRYRKDITFYKTPSSKWNECLELLNKIEIDKLPNLKAPTSMRQYDGAAHAYLTIKNNKEEIKSSTFDHGFPPDEIKMLVEKLLSLKKLIPKQ